MTLEKLREFPTFQTAAINDAVSRGDWQTYSYIVKCLWRCIAGDYGLVGAEIAAANNAEVKAGSGRVRARYEKQHELTEDIYIIADFSEAMPESIDANHMTIMYCSEY